MESVKILDLTDNLAEMILQSDVVENYQFCLNKLQMNEEAQHKINAFKKMKERYEEAQRFGKFYPDYQTIMKETRHLKRQMDMDASVAEFRKAETDLQRLLDEVSVLIAHAVSPQIKVPTGSPFFTTSSTSSSGCSCGSGGGCGS